MPRDNLGLFSPADIREIRRQAAAGTLAPREWAASRQCGVETIRRIARRETYAHIPDLPEALPTAEPSSEALAASLARLTQAAQALPPQPREVNALLDELAQRRP